MKRSYKKRSLRVKASVVVDAFCAREAFCLTLRSTEADIDVDLRRPVVESGCRILEDVANEYRGGSSLGTDSPCRR